MTLSFHDYRNARRAARQRQRIARSGYICGHPLWSKREDETLRKAYPNYTAARTEVDPLGGTTGTGFLVGSAAVPIC